MRRLAILLATAAVVAGLLGPGPASGASGSGLRLGEPYSIPLLPGTVAASYATGDGLLWAALGKSDTGYAPIYTTPLDGSGSWEPWLVPGTSEQLTGRVNAVVGSVAHLSGRFNDGSQQAVVYPGGMRTLPYDSQLVSGGQYVRRPLSNGDIEVTGLDSPEPVAVITPPTVPWALSGSRFWTVEDNVVRGRALEGDSPDLVSGSLPLVRETGTRCSTWPSAVSLHRQLAVFGRWALLGCAETVGRLLVDLEGVLPTEFVGSPYPGTSPLFLQTYDDIVDPLTLSSVMHPYNHGTLDAGGEPVMTFARWSEHLFEVTPVLGVGGDLPDTTPPATPAAIIHTPVEADPELPTGSVTVAFRRAYSADSGDRFEIRVNDDVLPGIAGTTETLRLSTRSAPCFDARAHDRAGNVTAWVPVCARWDLYAPKYTGATAEAWWSGLHLHARLTPTFSDEGTVRSYQVRERTGGSVLGPWSAPYRYQQIFDLWPQRRLCQQARATDSFGRRSTWGPASCVTAPFDDRFLRGGAEVRDRTMGSLDYGYRRLVAGRYDYTHLDPYRPLRGRVVVARLRRGPAYGVAELTLGGKPVGRYNLHSTRDGWRWITYVAPKAFETTAGVRAVRGTVLVDAIGVSHPGDVYPPRQ